MNVLEFGSVGSRPLVLITGGVHGDEFEPIVAIRKLGETLDDGVVRGRVTLIPVVNEAAHRLGARVAEDGLDLARTCPGRADGSITERTAAALSDRIRSADAYIDLHSGGRDLRLLPFSGYMMHRDPIVLDQQRRMARAFGSPLIWGTTPDLSGRSLSVARDAGVAAIYAEYGGGGGCDPEGVAAFIRGCRNVLAELGVIDGDLGGTAPEPRIVEDDRPGSGHLQVQHPSPKDGIFEPSVRLGQRVERGDRLGIVMDAWGAGTAEIRAERSGVAIGLRAFAKVRAGDPLVMLLESPVEEGELLAR